MTTFFQNKLSFALLSFVALMIANASSAKAQIEQYTFDKAHTQVLFFVDHLGFSMSYGKFTEFDGGFIFDRTRPEKSSVNVTFQTDSIEMATQKWTDHMKNEDFFDVEKFPTMTFESTNIEVTGDNTAKITGDLTMLDQTHPVTLDVTYNKSGKHPFNDEYVSGFSAEGVLDRTKWGMNYGAPAIGKEVHLKLAVEGYRQGVTTTDSDN